MDAEERRLAALRLAVQFGVGLIQQGFTTPDIITNAARKFEAFLAGDGAKASA